MANIMEMLGTFVGTPGAGETAGSGMLGIWSAVVEFVMASGNEIVLLGVFAWLFVLGVGSIRKLITGV